MEPVRCPKCNTAHIQFTQAFKVIRGWNQDESGAASFYDYEDGDYEQMDYPVGFYCLGCRHWWLGSNDVDEYLDD
jgi:hypothetical protein